MDPAKVMIVEDDVIVAEDLSRALRASGYDVPGYAISGDEAMDLARTVIPDVILMDVFLGEGLDGITVARSIGDCMDVSIVFITACSTESMVDAAVNAGADGFIVKPFQLRQVIAAIKVALQRREGRRTASKSSRTERMGPPFAAGLQRVQALLSDDSVWTGGEPSLSRLRGAGITPREKEIIRGLVSYRRLPAVAAELGISVHTARNHLKSIFQKLDVHSQDELLQCLMGGDQA
jgi:DNA-binding NarL/FixJ family response regulator